VSLSNHVCILFILLSVQIDRFIQGLLMILGVVLMNIKMEMEDIIQMPKKSREYSILKNTLADLLH